jgi:hypothetical protein
MLTKARELMPGYGASFLFTGEVLGQRPMSQRRDTLRVIERDSGCDDILLRPLCAKRLQPIQAEREGLIDREQLHDFTGRGRKSQIALARELGITTYPNPAGGCTLADPNLGKRIALFYGGKLGISPADFQVRDIQFLLLGRQFHLPDGSWLILGRNESENEQLNELRERGDYHLKMTQRPGPTGILRHAGKTLSSSGLHGEILQLAAGLVVRFGKKEHGEITPTTVTISGDGERQGIEARPLADALFLPWQF